MSQSDKCLRGLKCHPLQNLISSNGESWICVGHNRPKDRQVVGDRFCHCWHNSVHDEHGHWDKRDLLDTVALMTTALSIDENIRVGNDLTEAKMNKLDLVTIAEEEQ
ncbi:hypothetical protein [Pseudomonas nitroreducens]|uniref:hypothetical protein n=1 Tax=Pseudomonas nitroreducens TaxID=46680 RepID=UPI003D27A50B